MTVESYQIMGVRLSHAVDERPDNRDFHLHVHDNFELYCMVSGNVGYVVEGRTYPLRSGSMMLMRSSETHRLVVYGKERYERYTLNFYPSFLLEHGFSEDLLRPFIERDLGERNLYLPEEFEAPEPLALFRRMCTACATLSEQDAILSHLPLLLCGVHAAFLCRPTQETLPKDEVGREMIEYINSHLTEELSLACIASQIHMSPSQVNRVFRRSTGTSVYHYILSKRLLAAQTLILRGESAVKASQACGFGDYSAFYRLYKKRFGCAPTGGRIQQK